MKFSEIFLKSFLKKQNSIPLGILKQVYKKHVSQKLKNVPFKWGVMIKISVRENEKFENLNNMGIH